MTAYFKMGDHAGDRGEYIVVDVALAFEILVLAGVGEDECSDALLDSDGATAVLRFVDVWIALSFPLHQRPDHGRFKIM